MHQGSTTFHAWRERLRKVALAAAAIYVCILILLFAYGTTNRRRDYGQTGFVIEAEPASTEKKQALAASPFQGTVQPALAYPISAHPQTQASPQTMQSPLSIESAPSAQTAPIAQGTASAAPISNLSQFKSRVAAAVHRLLAVGSPPASAVSSPMLQTSAAPAAISIGQGAAASQTQVKPPLLGSAAVASLRAPNPEVKAAAGSSVSTQKSADAGPPIKDGSSPVAGTSVSVQELAQTLEKNIKKSLDKLTLNGAVPSRGAAGNGAASTAKGPGGIPNAMVDSKSAEINKGRVSADALVTDAQPISDNNGIIGFSSNGGKVWEQSDHATFVGADVPFGGAARIFCGGDPSSPLSYGRLAEQWGGTGVGMDYTLYTNGKPSGCWAAGN